MWDLKSVLSITLNVNGLSTLINRDVRMDKKVKTPLCTAYKKSTLNIMTRLV